MNGKVIPDNKLRCAMHVLYNVYFEKWRHQAGRMSDLDWQQCVNELDQIIAQGAQYEAVCQIGMALLQELERRNEAYE